jgi:hypothetical protein
MPEFNTFSSSVSATEANRMPLSHWPVLGLPPMLTSRIVVCATT